MKYILFSLCLLCAACNLPPPSPQQQARLRASLANSASDDFHPAYFPQPKNYVAPVQSPPTMYTPDYVSQMQHSPAPCSQGSQPGACGAAFHSLFQ